jgi:hypothetical protein
MWKLYIIIKNSCSGLKKFFIFPSRPQKNYQLHLFCPDAPWNNSLKSKIDLILGLVVKERKMYGRIPVNPFARILIKASLDFD